MKLNIVIIGSGIGGLAAAIRLAVRGHDVTVFEKADTPGGMIKQLEWEGYRWDMGPSSFILSEQIEDLYLLAGKEMKISIRNFQLDPVSRNFFHNGLVMDAFSDMDAFIKEANNKTGESPKSIKRYLNKLSRRYKITRGVLVQNTFSTIESIFIPRIFRAFVISRYRDLFHTVNGMNRRSFRSDYMVQFFDRQASGFGGNPYKAPGTLNLYSHLMHNLGVYYPEKGMYALADELWRLADHLGVNFRFSSKIQRINLKNGIVKGVSTEKEFIKSDIVVSDIDIRYLYKELLRDYHNPQKYFNDEPATSVMVFYWAVDREYSELSFQNILFSGKQREEYDSLYKKEDVCTDPTIKLHISSKQVIYDAPEGCENWVVSVSVPGNKGQDWGVTGDSLRKTIIKKINKVLDTNIEIHIKKEFRLDPGTIEEKFGSFQGSIYGSSYNHKLSVYRNHPNFHKQIHGLYFVGRSVFPGGGIPMCLTSAMNVDQYISKHYSLGN